MFDGLEELESRETESEVRDNKPRRPDIRLKMDVSSVDSALAEAAAQWNIPVEDIEAKVLSSGAGFLGLFGKKLNVEVQPKAPLLLLQGRHFIEKILKLMGLDVTTSLNVATTEDVSAPDMLELDGPDAEEFIVGHYGDVLKALEYLLNLALRDPSVEPRVRLDSCGYRERRTRSLERLAEATARQAVEYGRPIRLEPMLSWERWVIHMTLKGRDDVRTESVGESPMRKVVILPKYSSDSGIDGGYSSRLRSRLRPRFGAGTDDASFRFGSHSGRRGSRRKY